jgi:hypothetical protein
MEVVAERRAAGATAREIDEIARRLGLPAPEIDWRRRVHAAAGDVLLGTTDDLATLREASAETRLRFVAAARLPLPATLLSTPAASGLERVAEEHRATPAGRLLSADGDAVAALARRTGAQPFLLTGCPEVSLPARAGERPDLVVLFPADLPLHELSREEALEVEDEILQRALRPLAKRGLGLELRASVGAPAIASGDGLREVAERAAKSLGLAREAIRVRDDEAFGTLAAATAVIALSERDLLRALVAGAERAAFAAFALEPEIPVRPGEGALARMGSAAELGVWLAQPGPPPNPAAAGVARLLGPLSSPGSAERVAQVVLAAAG